jgi:phospholipid transport system transporter-binding protein
MSNLTLSAKTADYYLVNGELTFARINKQTVNTLKFTPGINNLTIDLANVTATDSAGLALMIEWIKLSQQQNVHIHFKNIPEQLLALAKLSGLDQNAYFAGTELQTACSSK